MNRAIKDQLYGGLTAEEIESFYAGTPPDEAFEALDAAGIDNEMVATVLGQEVAQEFATWIYMHVK